MLPFATPPPGAVTLAQALPPDVRASFVPVKSTAWRSISGMRFRMTIDEVDLPPAPAHLVLLNAGPSFRLEEWIDGRVYLTEGHRSDVAFIPAGTPTRYRRRARAPQQIESFLIEIDPALLHGVVEGADIDPDRVALTGVLGGYDPAIERIGRALFAEMEDGGALGNLYADSLATALAVQLLRGHSSMGAKAAGAETAREGGLSPSALRRVHAYIEEKLDQDLSLAEIANVLHLSAFHFARLFRRSTGMSPHQYVIARRVERARRLLVGTDLPLHEVAERAGFADQSHLAKHTRRLLGGSPRALRMAAG